MSTLCSKMASICIPGEKNNNVKTNIAICVSAFYKGLGHIDVSTCVLEYDGSHAQMSRQRELFTNCSLGQNSLNSCGRNRKD